MLISEVQIFGRVTPLSVLFVRLVALDLSLICWTKRLQDFSSNVGFC